MALVFLIERLGTVFQMAISLSGIAAGTVLGLFSTGMLSRKFNTKVLQSVTTRFLIWNYQKQNNRLEYFSVIFVEGALSGCIASVILVGVITFGAQQRPPQPTLPMRTDGCEHPLNATATMLSSLIANTASELAEDDTFWLFRISFMYYSLIGCATVWIIGLPVSLFTRKEHEIVDEHLLAPFLRMQSKQKTEMTMSYT